MGRGDAAGGTGEQRAHGCLAHLGRRHPAAIGTHHGEGAPREGSRDPVDVIDHARRDVRVEHDGRRALRLAPVRGDLGGGVHGDLRLRERAAERLHEPALVSRRANCVQQADGDSLRLALQDGRDRLRDGRVQLQGPDDPTVGPQPFGHGEAALPGRQGGRPTRGEGVEVRPLASIEVEDVGETLRRDEEDPRARFREHGVRGHGGAVVEPTARGQPAGHRQRLQYRARGVVGRGGHLGGQARGPQPDHVGERAAGVDSDRIRLPHAGIGTAQRDRGKSRGGCPGSPGRYPPGSNRRHIAIHIGSPWAEILSGLLAFMLGGMPFGWLLAKLLRGVDLREVGSGNIGATNASRVFPKNWSLVAFVGVFLLDFAKGFAAAYYSHKLGTWLGADAPATVLGIICGAAVILGHVFSPYLSFKGGKGVATTLGVVTAVAPWSTLVALGIWGILVAVTRYVSLGSIGAMIALPVFYFVTWGGEAFRSKLAIFLFLVGLAGIVVWRHYGNIIRILRGRERRIGAADQL